VKFRTLAALGLASIMLLGALPSNATIIERIVAIVEDKAIMLSELKDRSRPYLMRIYAEVPPGAQRSAAISQVYKAVLDHIVDEELTRRAAETAKLSVSEEEVEQSLERLAAQQNLSVAELFAEAKRSGLSEPLYREEMRRQVLQAKLLNLRLQGRVNVTEADLRSAYLGFRLEERKQLSYRVAKLSLGKALERTTVNGKLQLEQARNILKSARSGADFSALVLKHSTDAASRSTGGLLPSAKPGSLPESVDRAAFGLELGEVSEPVVVGGELWILKLVERAPSELPPFEAVERELGNRVYLQKMDRAQREWLESLRKRSHVEIRL
jgi:peptidyl-prolyl cis-trans isomerase SurA